VNNVDSARFDKLTRELLSANSRRDTVKALIASLGVGVAWLGGNHRLSAIAKKGKGKGKGKGKKKKKKKTDNTIDTKALHQPCTKSSECIGDLLCDVANSQQSCPNQAVGKFCCVQTDAQKHCEDGCDCCGLDVICNGGFCQGA
jgi:hypothetical protein